MIRRKWTQEDEDMLRDLFADTPTLELAQALQRSYQAVAMQASKLGLRKGAEYMRICLGKAGRQITQNKASQRARFKPGAAPWNKAKKNCGTGHHPNSVAHRFKPGQISGRAAQLVQPIGTLRISSEGLLERKIGNAPGASNRRWHPIHRLVWEEAHGKVPRGHIVVFKPGMRTTVLEEITLERLELITQRENMLRNSVHAKYPPEVAKLAQLRGALVRAINYRTKKEAHEQ